MNNKTITISFNGNVLLDADATKETCKDDHISFAQWINDNLEVEELTLKGTLDNNKFDDFENELFKLNLKILHLDGFKITDYRYKDGDSRFFEEAVLAHAQCSWKTVSILTKIILSATKVQSFLFCDGFVFSEDKKSLIHAPETITEYTLPDNVEYIGKCAFCGYEQLESLTLNNVIKEIDDYAFCDSGEIKELKLPDSVTTLGKGAFGATHIEHLQLSKNLQIIPDECFLYGHFESLVIPPSIKTLCWGAFRCVPINSIIIPEGTETIEDDVFGRLKYIHFPSTMKEIESDFYYEYCVDNGDFPPYVEIHPDNPIYYSKKGTLFYKETGKQVLAAPFNEKIFDDGCNKDGDCEHCSHHRPTTEEANRAIDKWKPKAEAGDSEAQNNLGLLLCTDKWIEPNYEEGLALIKKAAEQGYEPAIMNLADFYHEGKIVEANFEECFRLLTLAAQKEDPRGMNNLAACYEEGIGTKKDLQKALQWYKAAFEAGYYKAMGDIKRLEK